MTLGSIKAYCRANYLCHLLRREDWSQGGSRATRREKQINPLIKLWSWAQLQQPTFFTICITSVFYGSMIWCVGACVFFIHCVYMLYLFYNRTIAHRANGICCTCTRLRIRLILSFSVLIQFSSKSWRHIGLNISWFIVYWTFGNKSNKKNSKDINIFFTENAFEDVVSITSTILPNVAQCVKAWRVIKEGESSCPEGTQTKPFIELGGWAQLPQPTFSTICNTFLWSINMISK